MSPKQVLSRSTGERNLFATIQWTAPGPPVAADLNEECLLLKEAKIIDKATQKKLKWTRNGRQWSCAQAHVVKWPKSDSLEDPVVLEETAPCLSTDAP
jgi:hypothetical protein